jgi:hypothetical protein
MTWPVNYIIPERRSLDSNNKTPPLHRFSTVIHNSLTQKFKSGLLKSFETLCQW